MLLLYVLMGVPAGYSSSVLYKSFKGRQWQQCTLMTALLFPSICFAVFLSLNLMSQRYHSTQVGDWALTSCEGCGREMTRQLSTYVEKYVDKQARGPVVLNLLSY